mmetsp:Transcript_26731/g.46343  ORF Transcript_26731/g.46343 Transcript_26731/m.46343 type:complete len:216 (-) Transcript_26731:738-1385(-)
MGCRRTKNIAINAPMESVLIALQVHFLLAFAQERTVPREGITIQVRQYQVAAASARPNAKPTGNTAAKAAKMVTHWSRGLEVFTGVCHARRPKEHLVTLDQPNVVRQAYFAIIKFLYRPLTKVLFLTSSSRLAANVRRPRAHRQLTLLVTTSRVAHQEAVNADRNALLVTRDMHKQSVILMLSSNSVDVRIASVGRAATNGAPDVQIGMLVLAST